MCCHHGIPAGLKDEELPIPNQRPREGNILLDILKFLFQYAAGNRPCNGDPHLLHPDLTYHTEMNFLRMVRKYSPLIYSRPQIIMYGRLVGYPPQTC